MVQDLDFETSSAGKWVRRKTILVVDDEEPIRKLVARVLKQIGYSVFEANGPVEARQIWDVHQHSIDLLFTDIIMPTMGGPELAREFVMMRPDLKVIFATGCSRFVIKETMELIPHKRFLEKPYTNDDLIEAVAFALQ